MNSTKNSQPATRHSSRKLGLLLLLVIAAAGAGYGLTELFVGQARVRQFEVRQIAEYPHDPKAFTQGLIFHDGVLYESTGQYGESTVRRVELKTGKVLQQVDLPADVFGEGLTLWNDRLIQLSWRGREAFEYDLKTLERTGSWKYAGEGWGLTHDGESLIVSDGSAILRFIDPDTHEVRRRVRVVDQARPVDNLNELEYVDGMILANIWYSDRIARIDPQTGNVDGWIDLTGLFPESRRGDRDHVLNGIAWDPESRRLFVTGKNWPLLFELTFEEVDSED